MATLEQIMDIEGAVELAAREALLATTQIQARLPRTQGLSPHQMVWAMLELGNPRGHQHLRINGDRFDDQYSGRLVFYVRTERESSTDPFPSDLHGRLRALIRVFMLTAMGRINARLTLHRLDSQPASAGTSLSYQENRYDMTELAFSVSVSILADAWPDLQVTASGFADSSVNVSFVATSQSNERPEYIWPDPDNPGSQSVTIVWSDLSGFKWVITNSTGAPYAYSAEDVSTPEQVQTWYLVADDSAISGATVTES